MPSMESNQISNDHRLEITLMDKETMHQVIFLEYSIQNKLLDKLKKYKNKETLFQLDFLDK